MPTVIDSLVMTVGLEGSQFQSGSRAVQNAMRETKDMAARTAKDLSAGGQEAAQFFSRIKGEALGLLGVLAGGIGLKDVLISATTSMASLGREARSIGVSVPALAAFSYVMQQNGASAESARQSVAGLASQIENFKVFGDSHVLRFLAPIGADVSETPLEIMKKFVEFSLAHKNDPNLVNLIGRGLGFDQGTINAVEALKSLAQYQRELNAAQRAAPTELQVVESQRLYRSWFQLEQTAKSLRNTMVSDVTPALSGVLDWMNAETKASPHVIEGLAGIVGALTALGALRISASVMGLTGLSAVFGGIAAGIERILPILALLGLTGPAGGTDKAFSDKENALYNSGQPMTPLAGWWTRNMPSYLGGGPSTPPINSAA
ncbi:MAG TPA: hypothetical protein VNF49_01750, partial [Candidatus Binataceae bacterium]|nr:hypothetical protein [Candidatus Binataceae bacterium]